jgi:predicted ester cyclase
MLAEERKAFVRRQIDELWNKGNLEAAEECFTSDFVSHDPASPEQIRGPEGFKQNVAEVRAAFPNFHMRIVDQVAEGDRVVTRYVTTGTQEGELAGSPRPAGESRWPGWA